MKDKKILVSLRIDPEEKERLAKAAGERGMDLTDLLREGAKFLSGFSPWFLTKKMKDFERGMPSAVVIEMMLIDLIADAQVAFEKNGEDRKLADIRFTRSGYLTGEPLWNLLLEEKRKGMQETGAEKKS